MAAGHRTKSNSVAGQIQTFQKLANELPQPTEPLNEKELGYFNRIIRSRELESWSEHDLALATSAAMTMCQFYEAAQSVKEQGRTIENARGTPVANPELQALNNLSASLRAFTASLGLSAGQRGLGGSTQQSRNAAEQQARRAVEAAGAKNSLLA